MIFLIGYTFLCIALGILLGVGWAARMVDR